jgi:hypothetical protein
LDPCSRFAWLAGSWKLCAHVDVLRFPSSPSEIQKALQRVGSATGSPVAEPLARNSVGELVLIDGDAVEWNNLNRILDSTRFDARAAANKTVVLERAIDALGLGTRVHVHPYDLLDLRALSDLSTCDLVIGCMDSVDGRHVLNNPMLSGAVAVYGSVSWFPQDFTNCSTVFATILPAGESFPCFGNDKATCLHRSGRTSWVACRRPVRSSFAIEKGPRTE